MPAEEAEAKSGEASVVAAPAPPYGDVLRRMPGDEHRLTVHAVRRVVARPAPLEQHAVVAAKLDPAHPEVCADVAAVASEEGHGEALRPQRRDDLIPTHLYSLPAGAASASAANKDGVCPV